MCGQQNARATARDNIEHTPIPRIEIEVPDPGGNRTRTPHSGGTGPENRQ